MPLNGERQVSVPASPLGPKTVQVAIRFEFCAKLFRVKSGSRLVVHSAVRGQLADIQCEPKGALLSVRDVSHWSHTYLPRAGGADFADVDTIFGQRSRLDQFQAWASRTIVLGRDSGDTEVAIPLTFVKPSMPQLPKRLMCQETIPSATTHSPLHVPEGSVVVGTVRCGYGHHRIALALSSFSTAQSSALLYDFTAVSCAPPVDLLLKLNSSYSQFSRLASEDRTGVFDRLWNELLSSGDANASRSMRSFCERLKPLLLGLHPDTPIIAAHTFVAVTALLCGFNRVINLVFDNHAQYVHVVPPPAINLVQTPKCEQQLLAMGVPASHVRLVGHFVPKPLVDNAVEDSVARISRAKQGHPRRFLFSVGGAGGQRTFLSKMIHGLVRQSWDLPRGLHIMVNIGDHEFMRSDIFSALNQEGMPVAEHRGLASAHSFVEHDFSHRNITFTIFAALDTLEATSITDTLTRAADVLVTKPSELAFYPLPKLHIARIGDHEAQAAVRAQELGDGTSEVRNAAEAVRVAKALATDDARFIRMSEAVLKQARQGVYDGARRAFEAASSC